MTRVVAGPQNGLGVLFGSAKCRTLSRDPFLDSRWQVSSASKIPENFAATLLFPMIENTIIRQRQIVYLLRSSCLATLRTDCGAEQPNISLSTSMNRSGRWMRPRALPLRPEQVFWQLQHR